MLISRVPTVSLRHYSIMVDCGLGYIKPIAGEGLENKTASNPLPDT
jgi:hypothetical protein